MTFAHLRPIQVSSIQTAAAAAIGLRNHGLRLVHRDCLGFSLEIWRLLKNGGSPDTLGVSRDDKGI